MTLIAWNGGPIFRDGGVGTEQACCCGEPPPPCEYCNDCSWPYYWPQLIFEFDEAGITCGDVGTNPSGVYQDIFWVANAQAWGGNLPTGLTWKNGYPEALNGCNWALVVDRSFIYCCWENCTFGEQEVPFYSGSTPGFERQKYRIMLLTCPDGPESVQLLDITSLAVEGDTEPEFSYQPEGCPNPPVACTEWKDFFPTPEPVCNEFP